MRKHKHWYRHDLSCLTRDGRVARQYMYRICHALTLLTHDQFDVTCDYYKGTYECHVIDHGRVMYRDRGFFGGGPVWIRLKPGQKCADFDPQSNERALGMMFWGGFFSKKKYHDAKSRAWVSMLEDCIGTSEVRDCHSFKDNLSDVSGVSASFEANSLAELELILTVKYGV